MSGNFLNRHDCGIMMDIYHFGGNVNLNLADSWQWFENFLNGRTFGSTANALDVELRTNQVIAIVERRLHFPNERVIPFL